MKVTIDKAKFLDWWSEDIAWTAEVNSLEELNRMWCSYPGWIKPELAYDECSKRKLKRYLKRLQEEEVHHDEVFISAGEIPVSKSDKVLRSFNNLFVVDMDTTILEEKIRENQQEKERDIMRNLQKDYVEWADNHRYNKIPKRTLHALAGYVAEGVAPGGFLKAVLENNLAGAVGRADRGNTRALTQFVTFIYNYIPNGAWGSEEKVEQWIKQKGMKGLGL